MFGKYKYQSQSELCDQHQQEADRQLKVTAEQQAETERQLALTKQQQDETHRQLELSRTQQEETARQQARADQLLTLQFANAERQARLMDQQESVMQRLAVFLERSERAGGT